MKAPRDLMFQAAVDDRFRATVNVTRARIDLDAARATGIPVRVAGATRRLQNLLTIERQAKAALEAAFNDAAKERA